MVKFMDNTVRHFNNESVICDWLMLGCPDESTEEDYEYFTSDQEFPELCELFVALLSDEMRNNK